jgi:hypothetical protein
MLAAPGPTEAVLAYVARRLVRHEAGAVDVGLLEGLADAGDVAVAEDAEHAGDRALAHVAVDRVLVRQERDQGLADGQSRRRHRRAPLGAVGWAVVVSAGR